MNKGVSITRYLLPVIILCISFNLNAQYETELPDTTEYLPLSVPGALDYNLMLAASKGYYTEVERMVFMGADVDSETGEGVTPLVYAVYNNHLRTVTTLLHLDANVNKVTDRRETPLMIAVMNNNFDIAEALIRFGAEPDFQGSYGAASLHYAAAYGYYEISDLLLYYDASTDIKSYDGTTPLMAAVWAGFYDVAKLLISHGANMEARDNQGFTSFLIAAQNGDTLMMELLIGNGVDIYEHNLQKWDALNLAVRCNKKDAVQMLLNTGDKWSDPHREVVNPYNVAVAYRNKEMISLLEEKNFPASRRLAFDQMALSGSFRTDFRDFYSCFGITVKEPLRNIGFSAGFDTKLWYSRVLEKKDETLFFQYYDRSSIIYGGIFKEFPMTRNLYKSNYSLIASLSAGYSFGNKFKGTLIAPDNELRVIPGLSIRLSRNHFALTSGVEYLNSGFYKIGPLWWRFGAQYNFYFSNVRASLKTIKWY